MSTLTSKINDLNKELAGVEDEIKLSESRANEHSSQILKLQKQLEIANDVVLEIKLKKRQLLDEISSLISSEQAETPIESNIFNNPIEYLGLNLITTNICLSNDLRFVGDLVQLSETHLNNMRNLGGVDRIRHINVVLEGHGLKLNTKIENWVRPVIDE